MDVNLQGVLQRWVMTGFIGMSTTFKYCSSLIQETILDITVIASAFSLFHDDVHTNLACIGKPWTPVWQGQH